MIRQFPHGLNILNAKASCYECAEMLQSSSVKLAIVCDEAGRLLGTVSDGDLRRSLIEGKGGKASVSEVMNRDPKIHADGESKVKLRREMLKREISYVPKIDKNGIVTAVLHCPLIYGYESLNNTAVIMAGGRGERLRPLTDEKPKPLLEIGGKAVLERVVDQLAEQGISKFVFSVNYLGSMIEDYFKDGDDFGVDITYLNESEPLGTAGSLCQLESQSEPFFVTNADLMFQTDVKLFLKKYNLDTHAVIGTREFEYVLPFGEVTADQGKVLAIKEKPNVRHLICGGFYLFNPTVFEKLEQGAYLDMPDFITYLISSGKNVHHLNMEGLWIDVGSHADLQNARYLFSSGGLND